MADDVSEESITFIFNVKEEVKQETRALFVTCFHDGFLPGLFLGL
jgi:hypothetical protein